MKENNIIHGNIKLENILIKYNDEEKKDYTVKLTDYGISKKLFSLSRKYNTYSGKIATMAPEILEGKEQNDCNYKCDLWSIGIIIYRLLFGELPYPGQTEFEISDNIKNLGNKTLKKTENKELDDLIFRLLEIDPNKRLTWDVYLNHPFFNQPKKDNNNKKLTGDEYLNHPFFNQPKKDNNNKN